MFPALLVCVACSGCSSRRLPRPSRLESKASDLVALRGGPRRDGTRSRRPRRHGALVRGAWLSTRNGSSTWRSPS